VKTSPKNGWLKPFDLLGGTKRGDKWGKKVLGKTKLIGPGAGT